MARAMFKTKKFRYSELKNAVRKYGLKHDPLLMQWIELNPDSINFCGAKRGFKVPDTMWGLFIGWACAIHDGRFAMIADVYVNNIKQGMTERDAILILQDSLEEANLEMHSNVITIILADSSWFGEYFRLKRANKYFLAVHWGGENALFKDIEALLHADKLKNALS